MAGVRAGTRELVAGTRASRLAQRQTALVAAALRERRGVGPVRTVLLSTEGDRDERTPLPALGGRGVFTEALERELLAGAIDFAVHSLKDVPIEATPGLVLAAVGFREDPRDALVSRTPAMLDTLSAGARVGTCSTRRTAQLLATRPDLEIVPLRGNVDTRVRQVHAGSFDAILLAAAGLLRLGLGAEITELLAIERVVPAPGQGALAIQCRADDVSTRQALAALDDPSVRTATAAERGFLEGLGGGCLAPIAAHGEVSGDALTLTGLVASPDGGHRVRVSRRCPASEGREAGLRLADDAVAHGALELLA